MLYKFVNSVFNSGGLLPFGKEPYFDCEGVKTMRRVLLMLTPVIFLSACASSPKVVVLQHPETKSIVLLNEDEDTMICQPLFEKAGFVPVDAGLGSTDK